MIQKLRIIIMGLTLVALLAVPTVAFAQSAADCSGILGCIGEGTNATDPNASGDATDNVNRIITTVINLFSLIVGVVSVIMIIVGGFKYITSGGDSGKVTSAKDTILYAVVGLIVVAFAQLIVKFVLEKAVD